MLVRPSHLVRLPARHRPVVLERECEIVSRMGWEKAPSADIIVDLWPSERNPDRGAR
jgi:hypothetical protein